MSLGSYVEHRYNVALMGVPLVLGCVEEVKIADEGI